MADKEIIISGVNVNRCEDYGYRGEAGYWCHYYDEPCADYPNCEYKQLQRKTAECEKYEQALDEIKKMMEVCTSQDICTLCLYSNSCRNPDDFCSYDPEKVILNIITKAKGKEQC